MEFDALLDVKRFASLRCLLGSSNSKLVTLLENDAPTKNLCFMFLKLDIPSFLAYVLV